MTPHKHQNPAATRPVVFSLDADKVTSDRLLLAQHSLISRYQMVVNFNYKAGFRGAAPRRFFSVLGGVRFPWCVRAETLAALAEIRG